MENNKIKCTFVKENGKYKMYFFDMDWEKHFIYKATSDQPYVKGFRMTMKLTAAMVSDLRKMMNEGQTILTGEYLTQ